MADFFTAISYPQSPALRGFVLSDVCCFLQRTCGVGGGLAPELRPCA